MYAPASVENTRAWIPLVNKPNNINGIGTTSGTNVTNTPTTSSSAKMLPKVGKIMIMVL
jgi:hypothetical protein